MRALIVLRVVAGVHALAICLQPLFAGLYLNGSPAGIRMHETTGLILSALSLMQLLVATMWWRSGGRWTASAVSLLIVAGEIAQGAVGHSRLLAIHAPLGVALVVVSVAFALRVGRPRAVVA
ncbi:hypothetical protein [Kribbella sp. NPDC048915]|uniref:hypothetical protein n=1 Tax=Kribbella sp. NPDC048915 TaxID=3155148 RepID=UPI0033D1000D